MLFKPNQMPPVLTGNSSIQSVQPQNMNNLGHTIPQPVPPVMGGHFPSVGQDVDLRNVVDPRLNRNMDLDMRSMSANTGPSPMDSSYMRQPPQSQPPPQRPAPISAPFQSDPRQRGDPRVKAQSNILPMPPAQAPVPNRFPSGIPNDASDQEKAALIMQVLQLSDEQISMLPAEQRTSILVLKEQIAKSTQR